MNKRFVYFYFMRDRPEKIRQAVQTHVDYWRELNLNNYTGGPFSDRSGGLITFETISLEKAAQIVSKDPFVKGDLIENKWLKEWFVE